MEPEAAATLAAHPEIHKRFTAHVRATCLRPFPSLYFVVGLVEEVAELAEEGSMFIAAKGGAGGLGNAAFKSSTNKTPRVAEVGGEGEMFSFEIGET